MEEGGGSLGDGIEEEVGLAARRRDSWERAEDGDGGADTTGAAGHLEVFWRVADVDGFAGRRPMCEGRDAAGGMRFAEAGIAAADAAAK